jgi:hypothetical protein
MFRMHNAMALAMLRIFEDRHPKGTYPFVLPERNGILLGHTTPLPDSHPNNRIFMMAMESFDRFGIAQYEWIPKMSMMLNTFIGLKEMTPGQTNLRKALIPFYAGERAAGLGTEIDRALDTVKDERLLPERYTKAMSALTQVVESSLWKNATRLPKNLPRCFIP